MNGAANFSLGCAVWAYEGWVGDLFPAGSRPADFLRLYSRRLTAVEVNATFYAAPRRETITRWASETPATFTFCPKLPRDLTHKYALQPRITGALRFLELARHFGDRLGPLFAQLPPSYGPQQLDDLVAFLTAWPRREAPLAVEVRHPDWFREPNAHTLNSLLEQLGVGRVLLDTRPVYECPDDPQTAAGRRKPRVPLRPHVTAPFSVVRFISHPSPGQNQRFMEEWGGCVDRWLRQGVRVYFFVHCPREEYSPGTAREFQRVLERRGAAVPPLPWDAFTVSPTQPNLFG